MSHSLKTNLIPVVKKYLNIIQVPFTKKYIAAQLLQNPHYPTLYSISHLFGKYNLPSQAFELEKDQLALLEPPFITYYNGPSTGKDFIVVTDMNDAAVTFYDDGEKARTVDRRQFLQNWERIVMVAEPSAASKEPGYEKHRQKEWKERLKTYGLATGAALIILLLIVNLYATAGAINPVINTLILCTKMTAIAVTILLLLYDYDKTNSFVKNICTAGKQTGCDAVVNSNAGKIFGIKWSEAGFLYFASTFLFLLYPGITLADKIPLLAIAATAVSPYILFSIYYQAKIAKQWCPLCLATQFILLAELVWSYIAFWQSPIPVHLSLVVIAALIACILLPVVAWFSIKRKLYEAKDAIQYEAAYKRLLYNPEHFNQLLQQQQDAAAGWQQLGIDMGNPEAEITIIKVCNPYCGPCAKAHPVLEQLISENKNIKLKIIFTASNEENDRAKEPVKHLLAIAEYDGRQQAEKALDDWYLAEKKNYELFASMYPKNGELAKQTGKIDAMKDWCMKASITHTPTFFINGKRLPETYRIEELKNIF
ncbi:MAG: vitamin K epoxide reductase family protein [Ferruginibacter sp.]